MAALTAHINVEFAMFTKGNKRLVIRGNEISVDIRPKDAIELAKQGYRWNGHTHPGIENVCLLESGDDILILKEFSQEKSVTYNSIGKYRVFGKEQK